MPTGEVVVRVAVCQTFCIDSDIEGNFQRIENALEIASRQGAELACFPETAILGWVNPDAHKMAQPIPGAFSNRIGDLARRHHLAICIGMAEKAGDQLYDSAILVGSDGQLLLKHRKINTLTELLDPPYARGKPADIRVVDTPLGRIGILICADTFVKELVETVGKLDPDLLLVPYGWAAEKDKWPDHGKSLTLTVSGAARITRCPVVGTDVVGMITQGPWRGRTYGGQSVVCDAEGNPLAVLRDRDADVHVLELPIQNRASRLSPSTP